jgi:hypothetical protein
MGKIWRIILIVGGLLALILAIFFGLSFIKPKKAGIRIETTPATAVFIDDVLVGKTPYEATRNSGEIDLKLVPESTDLAPTEFETKILLSAGIKTIVKRTFAKADEESFGEIVSFEKTGGKESIAVVSDPDSAQVSIDGKAYGFTPFKTSAITSAGHQIVISAPGYLETTMTVQPVAGYKLTIIAKLAQGATAVQTPAPTSTPKSAPMVEILTTPSGFLRVREEPNTTSKELGRVTPGQKFEVVAEDSQTGWFKIEFTTGEQGWVSNQYAKKVNSIEP